MEEGFELAVDEPVAGLRPVPSGFAVLCWLDPVELVENIGIEGLGQVPPVHVPKKGKPITRVLRRILEGPQHIAEKNVVADGVDPDDEERLGWGWDSVRSLSDEEGPTEKKGGNGEKDLASQHQRLVKEPIQRSSPTTGFSMLRPLRGCSNTLQEHLQRL